MATTLESSGSLNVGRHTLYNGECRIVSTPEAPVSIGSYCAIGIAFTVMPLNHDTNYAAVQGTLYRRLFNTPHPGEIGKPSRERSKGGVTIGSDVWIADNVTVLSGVDIGDGCCIGAGSIVTRSLPPYTVAAGSPCRVLRSRFSTDVVDLLLELKWWEWTEDRISRNRNFFCLDFSRSNPSEIRALVQI